jgi:excinuclease UvrABC nuclease subunit
MNKYANSKIYKIINNTTPDIYVGSTTTSLSTRFCNHKKNSRNTHKNSILYKFMRKNKLFVFKIELIENVICENRTELEQHEKEIILKLNPSLNKNLK